MNFHRRAFLTSGASVLAAPMILRAAPVLAAAATTRPAPRFLRRRVGAFEVTILLDGTLGITPDITIGWDAQAAANTYARQHLPAPQGPMPIPVMGYVIDTGSALIAVDNGTVAGFSPNLGGYHAALAEAGFAPGDIDTVLLTHLHVDHVGGMVADGARVFDNAQVHVNATELQFWQTTKAPQGMEAFFDIARAAVAPYDGRIVTFEGDAEIMTGVQAVALPGHTPGHSGFQFQSEGEALLIWGDVIHLTKLQFDHPDWVLAFDTDPDLTRQTRARMLDMTASDGVMVAGSHLDFPGVGFVERAGGAYRYVAAPYDYRV